MPADLIVDLSFPGPDQGLSPDMSPSTYIHNPNMLSLLRREAWHEIGPEIQKGCTLEPLPIEADQTIKQYYDRVYERLSKEKISVRIPGEDIVIILDDDWEEYEKNPAAAVEQNKTYGEKIAKLETQNEDKGTQIEGLKIATLLKFIAQQTEARLKMYKANILVDFVKRVFVDLHLEYPGNLEEVKDTQAAQSLDQRQLEAFFKEDGNNPKQLAPMYYEVLQNISKYIDGRDETAHESHIEFAELLQTDQYHKKGDYSKWANLFGPVYGKTIEEIMDDQKAKEQDKLVDKEN